MERSDHFVVVAVNRGSVCVELYSLAFYYESRGSVFDPDVEIRHVLILPGVREATRALPLHLCLRPRCGAVVASGHCISAALNRRHGMRCHNGQTGGDTASCTWRCISYALNARKWAGLTLATILDPQRAKSRRCCPVLAQEPATCGLKPVTGHSPQFHSRFIWNIDNPLRNQGGGERVP
jgi:hypothetical protein